MQEEMRLFKEKEGKVHVPDETGIVEAVEEEEVMERQKVDLVPLFRMACDDFRAPKDKEINVLFFPFVDDLYVMGDRKKLGEMLSILLNNAANFSPSKSKIKVFLEKKDDNALNRSDGGKFEDSALTEMVKGLQNIEIPLVPFEVNASSTKEK